MSSIIARTIPSEQLRRLDFLLGEASGYETMYPPGGHPVQFVATYSAGREDCERFLKLDFFCDIPGYGIETFRAQITWSDSQQCYRMWIFSAYQEEPMLLKGDFEHKKLILISDPWPMPWGLQRMRCTLAPIDGGGMSYFAELWEPDGYAKYCTAMFNRVD
jgi:hypothetical protein